MEAYEKCYQHLTKCGFTAKLVHLDNEISKELIMAIEKDNLDYQIASPGDHQTNPTEGAMKHAKAHFKSVWVCADPTFNPKDWDLLLLPQTELTLNLLCPSKINPCVSAYTIKNGHYDYSRTPMVPAVTTKVVVYKQTNERDTWSDCGINGYYIQPAMKHYWNFQCYIPRTNAIRRSNTVDFFPTCCDLLPALSPLDHLTAILGDLKDALLHIQNKTFHLH